MHYWQLSPLTRHAGLALLHSSPGRHRHAPVPVIVLQQHPAPRLVILHDLQEKKHDEKRNANDLENSQMVSFPALFRSRVGQCRPSEPPSPSCHWEKIQNNNNDPKLWEKWSELTHRRSGQRTWDRGESGSSRPSVSSRLARSISWNNSRSSSWLKSAKFPSVCELSDSIQFSSFWYNYFSQGWADC